MVEAEEPAEALMPNDAALDVGERIDTREHGLADGSTFRPDFARSRP